MIRKVKKEEYEDLYHCIVSDQVPADEIAEYFEDEELKKVLYCPTEQECERIRKIYKEGLNQ